MDYENLSFDEWLALFNAAFLPLGTSVQHIPALLAEAQVHVQDIVHFVGITVGPQVDLYGAAGA